VFFETRKPTINFKGLFQQIKNNQNVLTVAKRGDKNSEVGASREKTIFDNQNSTATTLHAMLKSKRLKTEVCGGRDQEDFLGGKNKLKIEGRIKSSQEDLTSFTVNDKSSDDGKKNNQKGLKCEESVPALKRKFILNNNTPSLSDIS
jgi:hypothetical protein